MPWYLTICAVPHIEQGMGVRGERQIGTGWRQGSYCDTAGACNVVLHPSFRVLFE